MSHFANLPPFQLKTLLAVVEKYPPVNRVGRDIVKIERRTHKDVAFWDVVERSRARGSFSVYGSASKPVNLRAREQRSNRMAYYNSHVFLDMNDMMARALGTWDVPLIAENLAAEMQPAMDEADNLKEWSIWQTLTTHGLAWDQDDVKFTITAAGFGVPTTHTNVAPAILWSSAATATPSINLSAWARLIMRDSNVPCKDGWMNGATMELVCAAILAQGDNFPERIKWQAEHDGIVDKLGGVNLHVYDAGCTIDGTWTPFIPANVVAMAAPDAVVMHVGSQAVPVSPATTAVREQYGRASWSLLSRDPVGMKVIVSDVWMPVIEQPERVLYATVA